MAKSIFEALGAKCYVINAQPNGFNINNDAGSTHIDGLQKFLVDNGLDVGFAYDGDADCCLCVDELGNVITGDHILYIYGRYMKDRDKLLTNTVVTTIMCNFGQYKAFDELGIGYAKTAVADKAVALAKPDVQAAIEQVTAELGDSGRILARESGTEPVIRVMVEAESEDICRKYVDMVVQKLEVGLNKLNCILGVNPLYYSYGIADYFLRLLANFELCFNEESNILETIIVFFDW